VTHLDDSFPFAGASLTPAQASRGTGPHFILRLEEDMDNTQSDFDQAYWASQPPEVASAFGPASTLNDDDRATRAQQLAQQGFTIDIPIMAWKWDPYLVMTMRLNFGYTWVPAALQPPIMVAPGLSFPGEPSYNPNNPPAGSIPVSVNIQDYPPYAAPPSPVPPAPTVEDPVGVQAIGNLYLSVPGESYSDGAQYTDSRGTFVKHVAITPFGRNNYWEKIS
jgi:hypothetical protein